MPCDVVLFIHTGLCLGLLWLSFCRAVRTDRRCARRAVRVAIAVQATAAIAAGAAPLIWCYMPEWPALMTLAAYVLMQGATLGHWRAGVPEGYRVAEVRSHG